MLVASRTCISISSTSSRGSIDNDRVDSSAALDISKPFIHSFIHIHPSTETDNDDNDTTCNTIHSFILVCIYRSMSTLPSISCHIQ